MSELCSIVPVGVDRRRRCRDSTPVTRQVTRVCVTRPIRRRSKRLSPSCAPPATGARPTPSWTGRDHVASRVAHPGGSGSDRGRSRSTPGWLLVRRGKADRRREVAWTHRLLQQLQPWPRWAHVPGRSTAASSTAPRAAPLVARCGARRARRTAAAAGVRRRFAPHQLRHAHAVEMPAGRAFDRHPAPTRTQQPRHHLPLPPGRRQRQIIETVHARRAPMLPVSASLRL